MRKEWDKAFMTLPTACSLFLGIPFFTRSLKGNVAVLTDLENA
jgi:hypothetical protein